MPASAKFLRLACTWKKDIEKIAEELFKYTTESVVCPHSLINSDCNLHWLSFKVMGFAPPSYISENLTKIGTLGNVTHLKIVKDTAAVAFSGECFSMLSEHWSYFLISRSCHCMFAPCIIQDLSYHLQRPCPLSFPLYSPSFFTLRSKPKHKPRWTL